jgi:formate hydrogenlyase transcriptional activator
MMVLQMNDLIEKPPTKEKHQHHRDLLQDVVADETAKSAKSEEVLEECVRFEDLVLDLSSSFVNVPHDRLNIKIAQALRKIREFFKADHCGLLEVLADHKQVYFLNLNPHHQDPIPDIAPRYPWAYHQLVERSEPMIISSLETLPPEASVDRFNLEQEDIQALLLLPLHVGEQVGYLIGLWSHRIGNDWPTVHIRLLHVLAGILVNALIQRQTQEALLKSERMLTEAERIAHLGSWIWDINSDTKHWSDEYYRIFGLVPQEIKASHERFLASVHPDDRQAVQQANREAISNPEKTYAIEYRIVRPDGNERVVQARAEVFFDQNRRPLRMIGTAYDITDRKRGEEALKKAFDENQKLKEQLEVENIYLRDEMELKYGSREIIGISDPIKYVMRRIQQVAATSATVLLTGETGTGKGLFARYIHEASGRRDKPFVNVNCAGLPPNLIESELFGREKGAFTGSTARQIGRFELANGGTIFLDEIGELSLELQAKLLRVIEDGEFERLGSPHTVKVDVRIIASTNRNLEDEIKKGQFRKDIFYRLNAFPITIPPLSQRKKDIPLLVKFYADRFSKRYGKRFQRTHADTMKDLENYSWPGNVRELINVVERAVIISDGPELQLHEKIDGLPIGPPQQKETQDIETRETKGLAAIQREHILRALHETGWRIEGRKGAAQLLEMNPSTLKARMRKLGIKRPRHEQAIP